jgi:hypothetical protein
MRNHVTDVSEPRSLRLGDHVAWCGSGPEDMHALALELFAEGVARHERMFYVAGDSDFAALSALPGLEQLLADGALHFIRVDDIYLSGGDFDVDAQLAAFTDLVDAALADGYHGIRVLADNTSLLGESDEDFLRWLQWEHVTDRFQSLRPVLGVCFFDASRIPADRLAALAGSHPVTTPTHSAPPFRWFYDGDVAQLTGEVDIFSVEQLRGVLAATPRTRRLVVDLAQTKFVDHHTLLALADLAGADMAVHLHNGPPYLPTVHGLLDLHNTNLHIVAA